MLTKEYFAEDFGGEHECFHFDTVMYIGNSDVYEG